LFRTVFSLSDYPDERPFPYPIVLNEQYIIYLSDHPAQPVEVLTKTGTNVICYLPIALNEQYAIYFSDHPA
jgi:hypothetical protein